MDSKNRYIAIAWYTTNKSMQDMQSIQSESSTMYILYDTETLEIKVVSGEALKLIHNKILNISFDGYIDHLNPIWRFVNSCRNLRINKESTDIQVTQKIKEYKGQQYVEVILRNVLNKDKSDLEIIFGRIVADKEYSITSRNGIYSGIILNGESIEKDEEPNSYKITIYKKIGYSSNQKGGFIYNQKRGFIYKGKFIKTNTNNEINEHLESKNNKLKMLGQATKNYSYIEDKGTWLIDLDTQYDNKEKEIIIPSSFDYIGYELTKYIVGQAVGSRHPKIFIMTQSQLDSMLYNIMISPLAEMSTDKSQMVRVKTKMKENLSKAIDNHKIIIR